ncbi:MAG: hypothetical protein II956_05065 [Bacteroidales bacterium]|nr:hypothetical protein [Bacteroidales bacterium]
MASIKQIFKTVIIIITVLLYYSNTVNAQVYNNWLLSSGSILNFENTPATIICNNKYNDIYTRHTVMLSDDNGQIILHGYKKVPNVNTSISDFVIKDNNNHTIISYSCTDLRNVIGWKLPQGGYYIAAVFLSPKSHVGELHIYKFDASGNFEQEFVYNEGNYIFFIDFIRTDDFITLIAYKHNKIETYKLTSKGCSLWKTTDVSFKMKLIATTVGIWQSV